MAIFNDNRKPYSANKGRFLQWGPYALDLKVQSFYLNERRVELPPCTLPYLVALLRRAPEAVSYQDLAREAQGHPLPQLESQDMARLRIYMLRKAMGDSEQTSRYIAVVPGFGYRLNDC
jgi:DNA-binding response OmpR family regulator